jgi:hypothetical protein
MIYAVKILLTALMVVAASETAKRVPAVGAAIISLPLASMIAMGFLYFDTRDVAKVAEFARSIPPMLIPSVIFFYAFSFLVESQAGFVMAMVLATAIMLLGYGLYLYLFVRNG